MNRDVCEHFNPVDLPCAKCAEKIKDEGEGMSQPEALRLAYALDAYCTPQDVSEQAAAELRRLYKLLMDMQGEIYTLGMARSMEKKMAELSFNALEKQRDALLEALRGVMSVMPTLPKDARHIVGMEDRYKEALVSARAALKKAEGV